MTRTEIIELYTATFNRAADADGVAYWVTHVAANGKGATIRDMITAVKTQPDVNPENLNIFTNKVSASDYTAQTMETVAAGATVSFVSPGNPTGALTVTSDPATVITANTAVVAIATTQDAAKTITYTIAADATSVTEGSTVTFTVTASAAKSVTATTLNYQIAGVAVAGGTAAPLTDFATSVGTLTIAAGATTGTITLTPTDDLTAEGYEGFNVAILDSSYTTVATSSNVVILDGTAAGTTYALTTGVDTVPGTASNDTITGTQLTLSALDNINGGAGTDTMTITSSAAATAITVPTTATIANVETANITSTAAATANTTAWTGLTTLNVTSVGGSTVTAATTTDITATETTQAATAVAIEGGKDLVITASGVTTGTTTIGATTQNTGTVIVNSGVSAVVDNVQGAIAVTGGTTVSVTTTTGSTVNKDYTQSAVTVTGTNSSNTGDVNTTDVTVIQQAAATKSATVVGKINGVVTIADANAASLTAAGTITTVSLTNYANSTIDSGALAAVSLSGTAGTLGITAGALTTATVNTLGINAVGLSGTNAITVDADYTTLNIDNSTTASTIANITATGATTVNVSGDKLLTLTDNTFAAATAINVTNTAGATFGTTAIGTGVTFTGGAGAETATFGATTKAITTGAGDDVLTVTASALGTGGSIDAGDGTDTLTMTATLATAADASTVFAGTISNFERLSVTGMTAETINLANLDAINYVTVAGTVANAAAIGNALTGITVNTSANTTALGVVLTTPAGLADSITFATESTTTGVVHTALTLDGFETIAFTTDDSANKTVTTTATTGVEHAITTLTAANAKTITVAGDAGLTIGTFTATTVTSFDASGVTAPTSGTSDVSYTTGALAAASAITGGAGNDTLNAAAALAAVTMNGGAGNDTLTGSSTIGSTINGDAGNDTLTGGSAVDTINGGDGNDTINGNGGDDVITGGAGDDTIDGGSGTDSIDGGAGDDTIVTSSGTDTIDGGDGTDILQISSSLRSDISTLTVTNVETLDMNSIASTMTVDQYNWFTTVTNAAAATLTTAGTLALNTSIVGVQLANGTNTVTASTTAADYAVTGGTGNDTFNIDGATFTAADSFAGGTGVDTLNITGNTELTDAFFDDASFAAVDRVNLSNTTEDVTWVITAGETTATNAFTLDGESLTTGVLSVDARLEDAAITIIGGSANDVIVTGTLGDTISTGAGDDTITIAATTDANDDVIDGGTGTDTLAIIDEAGTTASHTFATDANLQNVENITFQTDDNIAINLSGQTEAFNVTSAAKADTAGTLTYTGSAGVDTLTLTAAHVSTSTITGGLGADIITLGAAGAAETIVMTTGGAIDVDQVTNFATGEDFINIDLSDLNALVGTMQLSDNSGVLATDATPILTLTDLAVGGDYGAAAAQITSIATGTAYTESTLATAIAAGTSGGMTAGDAFLVLYDNTADSYLAYVTAGTTSTDGNALGTVTVTNILQLTGLADNGDLVVADFSIIT